jgi:hypothetical protein
MTGANFLNPIRSWQRLCVTGAALALAGCATPDLDRRIVELRQAVSAEQQSNQPLANPYRAPAGKDIMVESSAAPLLRVLDKFNGLSTSDRILSMNSYDYSGYIAQSWTRCPWTFDSERIGFRITPAFDEAFAAVVYIDEIENGWSAGSGLSFKLKRTVGAAGMIVGGRVWLCGLSGDVPLGLAAVVGGANSAGGSMRITPRPNVGLEYRVSLDQPLYFIAYVATPVFSASVPLKAAFDLTEGTIPNLVGREGEIQVAQTGEKRRYVLDVNFDQADFLAGGLRVAGPVTVTWQPAP